MTGSPLSLVQRSPVEWNWWRQVAHLDTEAGYLVSWSWSDQEQIWLSSDMSTMHVIPEELTFQHYMTIMTVERHNFLQVLCLLFYIYYFS